MADFLPLGPNIMKTNFVEELRWRGMLFDLYPGTEEALQKEMVSAYIGFDPTAASLHIGNLVTIMLLKHFQLAGHKPIALVGGATGMVGDPSGKSEERNLLTLEKLIINQAGVQRQLEKFLDFQDGPNAALVVNNYDWFKDFSLLTFLREVGKHLTVNYMMAKDSVKKRLETGISFTEFSYQLLQGYDFFHLWKNHQVKLQMGGSDQWGNITAGTELIRRMEGGEAFALTTPLLTKADGSKFGKSESGNIWLDAELTSPYTFYQYFLNVADEDAPKLIRVFTLLPQDEIIELEAKHLENPHLRILQQKLAEEITIFVHGQDELAKAKKASEILFGKGTTEELEKLDENLLLAVFEGVPQVDVDASALETDLISFLSTETHGAIFPSKGEARKMLQNGGVSINKAKIESPESWTKPALLHGKYLLVQKGKKNYFLVKVN